MSEKWRHWWRARSLREQRLLMVMAALAVLVLVWIGVLRPLEDARGAARQRHGEALVALAGIEAEAARLAAAGADARPSGSIVAAIGAEADALAITPSRLEIEGDGARLDVPVIGAAALFTLIDRLRARGIAVDTLAARPEAGGSLVVTMRAVPVGGAR